MLNRRSKHWVLVADSGQARILELQRKPYEFRLVSEIVSESRHLTSRQLDADASGRSFHALGTASHSIQPRADAHQLEEERFVRSLAGTLDKAARLGIFDHLVLVCDPRTLGRLRQCIGRETATRVADELALDLGGLPLQQLESRIRSVLGWKV